MKKQIAEGITISTPDILEDKMEAIVNLSRAISSLSEALVSVNTKVEISDVSLKNMHTGIKVSTERS